MKTRRSKRLSKSPVSSADESSDLTSSGKKQKLEKHNSLTVNTNNGTITNNKRKEDQKGFDSYSKTQKDNGCESDSSDSSVDYMKSPQALDLNSDFFKVDFRKEGPSDFSAIENKIFSQVKRLTDTEGSSSEEGGEIIQQDYIPIPFLPTHFTQAESANKNVDNKKGKKCNKKMVKSKVRNSNISDSSNKKKNRKESANIKSNINVEKMDISELLALGETQVENDVKKIELHSASEGEASDWEEVKTDVSKEIKKEKHSFPKDGVQITVDAPDLYHKRKKKGFDMVAYMKRRMNQVKREQQILIHKVHLLCWVAHGLHVNSVLNSEELMGLSLSLIPSQHSYPNRVDTTYLKKIAGWFVRTVPIIDIPSEKSSCVSLHQSLQQQFEHGAAQSGRDLVLMFICLLRSLGLTARLIISLQPLSLKSTSNEVLKVKEEVKSRKGQQNKKEEKKKIDKKVLSPDQAKQLQKKVMSKEEAIKRLKSSGSDEKIKSSNAKKPKVAEHVSPKKKETDRRTFRPRKNMDNKYKDASSSSEEEEDHGKKTVSSVNKENGSTKKSTRDGSTLSSPSSSTKDKLLKANIISKNVDSKESSNTVKETQHSTSKNSDSSKKSDNVSMCSSKVNKDIVMKKKRTLPRETKDIHECSERGIKNIGKMSATNHVSVKNVSSKEICSKNCKGEKLKQKSEINTDSQSACTSQTSEDEFIPHSRNRRVTGCRKQTENTQTSKKQTSTSKSESDSDFENELTSKIKQGKRNSSSKSDIDRRVLSSDSDDANDANDNYNNTKNDFWTEVLVDSEDWIPINVITGEINCIEKLRKNATKPVAYIVAWNPDLSLKDVTRRYCTQFHSVTRKQRVDEEWWRESLFPFLSANTARDKKEDESMQKQIEDQPLPTSIAEYKNHPLYALKRHLLKFQAIYPSNAPTLGFVKSEPVYARECVHTLHSRDIWLKEAKVVRLGEQPYKIVKARPKWDRMSGKVITDMPLEIFGSWQVEDYVPPTAVDGKVPRNAYGNVELFKPSMLPKGTVHLQVPCLNRVAKKLQIDCAPAVVGFDFHCGASHPMYDGFVVCEEFQDVLLDAWNRDQEEAERREQEKRDKRVYGNWRRLIKGLFIRERLKIKYAFGEEEASTSKGKKGKRCKPVTKKVKDEEEEEDSE